MVEENPGRSVQVETLAIHPHEKQTECLTGAVRRDRGDWGGFRLWRFCRATKDLRRGRLKETDRAIDVDNRVEEGGGRGGSQFDRRRGVKPRRWNKGNRGEVKHHRRSNLLNRVHYRSRITQVNRNHFDVIGDLTEVRIFTDHALALCPKNLDASSNEILSEVRTVLAADPCNECLTVGHPAIVPSEAPFDDASAVT